MARPAGTPRLRSRRSTTHSRKSCSPTPPSSSPRSRTSGSAAWLTTLY
uniref:FPPS n=1 Tax=Arundo donax TaxID=35708 RepID=A0A0A9HIN8_ARUDO